MDQPWFEQKCIICGGGRTNAHCHEHFYSEDDRRDKLIQELLERVEALEERNQYKPQQHQPKPKPIKKSGGTYTWKD